MFKGSVWFLHPLIKTFLGNQASKVSSFSVQYSRYSNAVTTKLIHIQETPLHHNNNLLDANMAKKFIQNKYREIKKKFRAEISRSTPKKMLAKLIDHISYMYISFNGYL